MIASEEATASDLSERVMVVFHTRVPESREVAVHYAERRGIPQENLCGIAFPSQTSLRADHYAEQVKAPLRDCLQRIGARQVLYIVFSYRTPYRVMLPNQRFDASVDSLVADLWDEVDRTALPIREGPRNPYAVEHQSQENRFVPFKTLASYREEKGTPRIYSVWRLDASSVELAKGLVDKAIQAEQEGGPKGIGCFDRNTQSIRNTDDNRYGAGEWAIQRAADLSAEAGFKVVLDTHKQEFGEDPAPARCEPAALYAGWYSLNHYNDAFTWSVGAIGLHLDSMSAWNMRTGKSWVVNAVNRGIAVSSGAVSEPFLHNLAQPDGVLHALFSGANVGDAFLRNTRLLKWRIVNVGDPLYRPFPGRKISADNATRQAPSIHLRMPAVLAGIPAAASVRAAGDPQTQRVVRLSLHPAEQGTAPSQLRFAPGQREQQVQIHTKGTTKRSVLRLIAEGDDGFSAATLHVLPVMQALTPAIQHIQGGESLELQAKLGAMVQSGVASFKVKNSCPKTILMPGSVTVQAGSNMLRIKAATKPVQQEITCRIAVEKFGVQQEVTVVLLPDGPRATP